MSSVCNDCESFAAVIGFSFGELKMQCLLRLMHLMHDSLWLGQNICNVPLYSCHMSHGIGEATLSGRVEMNEEAFLFGLFLPYPNPVFCLRGDHVIRQEVYWFRE